MKNLIRLIENFFAENARFFEYYVRILALKIGDMGNMIWDALYVKQMKIKVRGFVFINVQRMGRGLVILVTHRVISTRL